MTSLLPPRHTEHLADAAAVLDDLYDAGDAPALAWNLIQILEHRRQLGDLARQCEDFLIEIAPWSGGQVEFDGLPVMELRSGRVRKQWDTEAVVSSLRRHLLDPAGTGELPAPEVVEAVEEALAVCAAVLPLSPSNGPRVRALAPIVRSQGHDVDEFCESTPGRQTVQIHEGGR